MDPVQDKLFGHLESGATFDESRTCRYVLWRRWAEPYELPPFGPSVRSGVYGAGLPGQALFILLNPSTADEREDDPTIRRCIGFARAWGHKGLTITNLYPVRSTDPKAISQWLARADAPGELALNRDIIGEYAHRAAIVVAAWGAFKVSAAQRGFSVERVGGALRAKLQREGVALHVLGITEKSRCPEHPLYLPKTRRPVPWA